MLTHVFHIFRNSAQQHQRQGDAVLRDGYAVCTCGIGEKAALRQCPGLQKIIHAGRGRVEPFQSGRQSAQ